VVDTPSSSAKLNLDSPIDVPAADDNDDEDPRNSSRDCTATADLFSGTGGKRMMNSRPGTLLRSRTYITQLYQMNIRRRRKE
tara:strand:+ start:216 stop:461 length:246 start_codon:yes stop_codon:yes gene_type:complete